MTQRFDRLPAEQGLFMQVWAQKFLTELEAALDTIETTLQDIIDLNDLVTSAEQAIADVEAATQAAQDAADATAAATSLANSYVTGVTITATDAGTDATVTVSAHTRHYPQADGTTTSVAVNGGSVTGLSYDTAYFLYYDDAARTGGAVTYAATTSDATAAQVGNRHLVGGVTTPAAAAADVTGEYTRPPGVGTLKTFDIA